MLRSPPIGACSSKWFENVMNGALNSRSDVASGSGDANLEIGGEMRSRQALAMARGNRYLDRVGVTPMGIVARALGDVPTKSGCGAGGASRACAGWRGVGG